MLYCQYDKGQADIKTCNWVKCPCDFPAYYPKSSVVELLTDTLLETRHVNNLQPPEILSIYQGVRKRPSNVELIGYFLKMQRLTWSSNNVHPLSALFHPFNLAIFSEHSDREHYGPDDNMHF